MTASLTLALNLAGCGALLGFEDDYGVDKPDGGKAADPDPRPREPDAAPPEGTDSGPGRGGAGKGSGKPGAHAGADGAPNDSGPPKHPVTSPPDDKSTTPPDEMDSGVDEFPPLDDCKPTFQVSNGIKYPSQSTGDLVFDTGTERIDTDTDPRCDPSTPQHCVIVANSIRLPFGASQFDTVGVIGSRALVLLAAHDISIEGVLNVGGGDGAAGDVTKNGPGDHSLGTALYLAGGGGLSTPGGGDCERRNAGRSVPSRMGLVAGGDGAPFEGSCTAGGGGGGALQLVSLCGTIHIRYYINARGGGGFGGGQWNDTCLEGYGGGAGGTVWLQAKQVEFADPKQIPLPIQLNGGGGGGGACKQPDGTLVAGAPGIGHAPERPAAAGGMCEGGKMGGNGGVGGALNANPTRGEQPTPLDGTAYCGGGGGARGRLVLQDAQRKSCDGLAVYSDGDCEIADSL